MMGFIVVVMTVLAFLIFGVAVVMVQDVLHGGDGRGGDGGCSYGGGLCW